MVTITKIGEEYNSQILEISGLSTDPKPVDQIDGVFIANGSTFKEIDTGKEYTYNESAETWHINKSASSGGTGSGVNGKDGITPHIGDNGNWFIGTVDTGISAQGPAGKNGVTPHIGTNGNWYIGSANTGVSAKGAKGDNGLDGNGIKSAILNSDYTLTLTFDDDTTYTTPSIRGATGDTGSAGKNGSDGADGKDGSDGVGIASIEQTTTSTADGGNNVFTVTLTNGTTETFTVKNGSKGSTGKDGSNGVDGGHYAPVVTQPTTDTMQISFAPSKSDMPAVNPVTVNLPVSENSGQNLNLTSPNGTVYRVAVNDDGTLYTVKQGGEEPGDPEEPVLPDEPDEPVEPDVPDIEWHTITADEITGINADRWLIATYTGTAENILIPATLDGKPVVMNTAANAPFDTNGVIKNIRIENGVGGTFQANPSEGVYGLGNIQKLTAGAAVKRIVIDSDNPDCTEFTCSGATALEEVHGLHHLTALTNGHMMLKGTAIQKLDAYPPQLSNAKLMFWQCSNLETVPDISMELSDCNNMFLQCTKLSEVTVSAMKGCDITMIGESSPNGGNFTFRCNYGSSLYESFRGMICHSMNSKENLFIELLDNYPVEDIVMWGDSMTKAGNTTMGNMPDQLAEMVTDDVMVWNYGYSGNTIQTCATRFNNHPEKWGDTTVIWLGTNNTAMSGGDMTALIQSEFISKLTTDNYVVVGLLTTNYSDEKNAAFASAFGDHFLDIRGYFLEHMWEISGLTATEQDETDISNGLIPSSFRVDVTHLNPAGGRIVATAIREKLLDMGIITDAQSVGE